MQVGSKNSSHLSFLEGLDGSVGRRTAVILSILRGFGWTTAAILSI